jgi:hypothetical protein
MSTATASLPRTAGNGAALVVVAADFVIGLLEKAMAPKAKSAPQVIAAEKADTVNIWQLYRLTAGSDSVNQKTVAKLHDISAAN